ncbi:aminopeptidase P N-terminal domain-containing protein [Marivirga sp. S37H4]|uniref:Xaa-Pro aminopeptidase n=1 Tax=Marivirga aurantiaca TaxID=2802615 RepID=A0A935C5P7_9BACT|nr:aminopeptidase P N-terminal domain-containing protein [Marivirga aurantiaca]MBK6263934.1 aminopeptidase P N-terminal domain-containing protein [Marivirga aurantiaca]
MRLLILSFVILSLLTSTPLLAQTNSRPTDFLSMDFHKERRQLLREKMPENSVTVVFSNPIRNRANDVNYMYHQDPNFYYLTGHQQPHALLLIFKDKQKLNNKSFDEILFIRGRNALAELYDGERLGTENSREKLAIELAFETPEFEKFSIDFSQFDQILFIDFQNDVRDTEEKGDLYDLIAQFKQKVNYPDKGTLSIEPEPQKNNLNTSLLQEILNDMRGIKTAEEIDLLRKAVKISALGQAEVMRAIQPGMSEMEVQGMHEFIYKKYKAEYEGYPSIVGAGHNGCVLHYIENYKPEIEDGELILMDLGAEYHGYTADVTRTIPVNGKFTKEQKQIYDLVYEAQEAAMRICKAGTPFSELYEQTLQVINEGLLELGIVKSLEPKDLIDPKTGRHRYYPHGCCHHIGLDVHDAGNYNLLEEGMVITIEPGIYIPEGSPCDPKWWNIPVRIEDDYLITADGYELLSKDAPRQSEEIEALMKEKSAFTQFNLPDLED